MLLSALVIGYGSIGKRHADILNLMDTIGKVAPDLLSTYKELGRQTIPVSVAKGIITESQTKELEKILQKSE